MLSLRATIKQHRKDLFPKEEGEPIPKEPVGGWKFYPSLWESKDNQRMFLDQLSKDLGITRMEGWYTVDPESVTQRGGTSLFSRYGNSMTSMITSIYPEHKWAHHKFE